MARLAGRHLQGLGLFYIAAELVERERNQVGQAQRVALVVRVQQV